MVRQHTIRYLKPAFAGQDVIIQTWVSYFRKTKALRKYRIIRPEDNALLVVAETSWTLIDTGKRIPRRVPAELADAFPTLPEDEEPTGVELLQSTEA